MNQPAESTPNHDRFVSGTNLTATSASLEGVGLGLRWSFLDEVLDGEAEGKVAFFELSPENYMRRGGVIPAALEQVADRHQLITHGLMMSLGGLDPLDNDYFGDLTAFLSRHGGPWHSDHVSFGTMNGASLHDLLPVPFTHRMAQHIADRVRWAQDRLGRPMLIENISYYIHVGDSELSETEFLREILERADCKLLLDVNNVDVNAKNFGFDALAWLNDIPMDRVAEIHVAGPEPWDDSGVLVDTHGSAVRPDVYTLLERAVEQTGPVPVLLERDSNIPPLTDLLDEVAQLDETYQRAVRRWRSLRAEEQHHAA